jgi:hypothetical protein
LVKIVSTVSEVSACLPARRVASIAERTIAEKLSTASLSSSPVKSRGLSLRLGLALGHTRKLLVAISDGLQLTGFKHVV